MSLHQVINKINQATIERYNARFNLFGPHVKTLGWNTKKNQWIRFSQATSVTDLTGKTILDIGCGFGDLLTFIKKRKIKILSYQGIDINVKVLKIAKQKHPGMKFNKQDILINTPKKQIADVSIALGLLNFNLKESLNNYDYARKFITKAFSICREMLIVDMLSQYRCKNYPKEKFVFYYSPEKMLKFALTLTPNVILKHDYPAIPQKEFILCLKK